MSEKFLLMVRSDHSLKPHAKVIADFAAERRPLNSQPVKVDFGDLRPDAYYADPDRNFKTLFAKFALPTPASISR